MKHSFFLSAALGACVFASVASAQITLVQWTFDGVTAGTTTNIAASSASADLTVSLLTDGGGTNAIGVRGATPFGATAAAGSATYQGPVYEVGMATTPNTTTPTSTDYALNFSLTVNAGSALSLSAFTFDLGYDTDFATSSANYFAPYAQLYVSTDGATWSAVGGAQTLSIGDAAIFSTGAGSGGVHYVQTGYSLDLTASSVSASLIEGETAYFRLALGDGGSTSDRRRVLVDNLAVSGTVTAIPEPSTAALLIGCLCLSGALARRRRHV